MLSNRPDLFFRTPDYYLILLHYAHQINHTRRIVLQLQLPFTGGYRYSSFWCFDTLLVPNDADVCALCLLFACSFRRHRIVQAICLLHLACRYRLLLSGRVGCLSSSSSSSSVA